MGNIHVAADTLSDSLPVPSSSSHDSVSNGSSPGMNWQRRSKSVKAHHSASLLADGVGAPDISGGGLVRPSSAKRGLVRPSYGEHRYGLVLDKTKSKKKSPGKLTLYWCGDLPQDLTERLKPMICKGKSSARPSAIDLDGGKSTETTDVHVFDVTKLVHAYNSSRNTLPMSISADRTQICGYLEVHLNLVHPISINQSLNPTASGVDAHSAREVVYLNDIRTKMVISSLTTSRMIIEGLMDKYKVEDDISNFGLFECEGIRGGPGGRQMHADEEPLLLLLLWGAQPKRSVSLQLVSNTRKHMDTMIHWEWFSHAELGNFLKMLNREEERYADMIRCNYEGKRARILRLMEAREGDGLAEKTT